MNLSKKHLSTILLIAVILVSFSLGFWSGKNSVVCKVCAPEKIDFSLLWEAWDILEKEYINPEQLNTDEMIYGAISGMVESLEDPYTVFFNPEEAKIFLEDVSGRFEGVGMEIGIREAQLQVIAPLEGTPAKKAGLRPGDKIIKIDGKLTVDITMEEAVTLIRGPRGTEVALTILRDDWNTAKEIKIKRAIIKVPSLKWELLEDNIAYIRIYHFSENADTDFLRASEKILKTPAEKIILDLRSNPGGYLEIAESIASWFLARDQIIVIEDFGGKREKEVHRAKGNSWLLDYPVVVLINEGTASASEILGSALRDNREVKIIGQTSFGKGSVQELKTLRDNSSLKVTVADWLTPKGELITEQGIKPDIEIEMTDKDYEQDRDPQLERAIEIIREIK